MHLIGITLETCQSNSQKQFVYFIALVPKVAIIVQMLMWVYAQWHQVDVFKNDKTRASWFKLKIVEEVALYCK